MECKTENIEIEYRRHLSKRHFTKALEMFNHDRWKTVKPWRIECDIYFANGQRIRRIFKNNRIKVNSIIKEPFFHQTTEFGGKIVHSKETPIVSITKQKTKFISTKYKIVKRFLWKSSSCMHNKCKCFVYEFCILYSKYPDLKENKNPKYLIEMEVSAQHEQNYFPKIKQLDNLFINFDKVS